jgi:hypothetical protein
MLIAAFSFTRRKGFTGKFAATPRPAPRAAKKLTRAPGSHHQEMPYMVRHCRAVVAP